MRSCFGLSLVMAAVLGPQLRAGGDAPLQVRIDLSARHPISPYIYGLNFAESQEIWGREAPTGIAFSRMGGNRLSAYNWETNASNCGNDCNGTFPNDRYLGGPGSAPAEAVRTRASWAQARRAALLATVPMLGFVAADVSGPVPLETPLDQRLKDRFLKSLARKGGAFSAVPDLNDRAVYQDEFVHHMIRQFPHDVLPMWFSLDNEPDLWGSTHEAIRGNRSGPNQYVLTEYDELVNKSVEYAAAIKDVSPESLVFGPALSNWNGFTNLFHNDRWRLKRQPFFLEYYLDRMREAERNHGRRLLDVLDVHWYAEVTSSKHQPIGNEWAEQDWPMLQARMQAPRSLWDPGFTEQSWVTRVTGGPIRLIPRLREMIEKHYPGTRLAITEYFYHRGGDISGALAQADALGIFGREGVFAAAMWPQGSPWAYKGNAAQTYACAFAAFRSFRDYDGKGSAFGDVSLRVKHPDPGSLSAYASVTQDERVILVLLNKRVTGMDVQFTLPGFTTVQVWRLTGGIGHCTGPQRISPDIQPQSGAFNIPLPPLSISTLVLQK